MNIYILNCPNTLNYGSMMMGENFITYFNKITGKKNNYYVETDDEINIQRLKEATGIKEIFPIRLNGLFKEGVERYDFVYGYLGVKQIVSEYIERFDLVVVLGGDDFTEDYGWKTPILNMIKFRQLQRKGLKVFMIGQTIGPYKHFRKLLMRCFLGKIDKIYLRDPISYDYLNKMGLKNIGITDDLALLPLAKQEIIAKDQKYITYCPSELIYRYAINKERSAWININLFILEEILKRYPDKKIVLLAHVLRPEHASDKIIVNELYNLISQNYGDRVIIKNNSMLPYEVRNYIQQSIFTVSSRMHPVISSLQCEIPAIAFSYSAKYWGIIGERYGLKDYILDVRFLEYEEMKNKFTEVIKKLEDNYEKIQESLKRTNKLAEDRIIKMLKDIALYCEDRKVNNNF